jgi:hypothetical protein
MFPLLIVHADDFGRLQGDAFTVKHQIVPASVRSVAEVEEALQCLQRVGMIQLYDVDGRRYLHVVDFDAHQIGPHKRTHSRFPAPPRTAVRSGIPGNSGNLPEVPTEENGIEEKRTEPKEEERSLRSSDACREQELVNLWNRMMPKPFSQVRQLTPKRRKLADARLREHSLEHWQVVFQKVRQSKFHRGESGRGTWVANFDWVIKGPDVAVRALEGQFDEGRGGPVGRTGPAEPGKYAVVEELDVEENAG